VERVVRRQEKVYRVIPHKKTFFLPRISAILPKGTRKIAVERRYAVATQPSNTASMPNSFPMEGRAILIEDPIKGMRKEGNVVIRRTVFFPEGKDDSMAVIIQFPLTKHPCSSHSRDGFSAVLFVSASFRPTRMGGLEKR